jgi:hypothetical protein
VSHFTLRIIIILMETIMALYKRFLEASWLALPLRPLAALGQERRLERRSAKRRRTGANDPHSFAPV